MEMYYTHCKECGKDYFVGLDGKDMSSTKRSAPGEFDGVPYIGFGNEQIEAAPKIPEEMPCKNCGTICKIEIAKAKEEK